MDFRRKSRCSLWPRTEHLPVKQPLCPCPSALGCFLKGCRVEESHLHLENLPSLMSAQPLHLLPPHSQAEGPGNAEKASLSSPLSQERSRNNKLLHEDQTVRFFFPVSTCSPPSLPLRPPRVQILLQQWECGLFSRPSQPQKRTSYSTHPPTHTQSALNSHTPSSSSAPSPLASESPGALV